MVWQVSHLTLIASSKSTHWSVLIVEFVPIDPYFLCVSLADLWSDCNRCVSMMPSTVLRIAGLSIHSAAPLICLMAVVVCTTIPNWTFCLIWYVDDRARSLVGGKHPALFEHLPSANCHPVTIPSRAKRCRLKLQSCHVLIDAQLSSFNASGFLAPQIQATM